MTSIATPTSSPTKVLSDPTNPNVYPSPSLSPVSALRTNAADNYRRLSVRELMTSTNPPASPLDALVMALEATAEGMTEHHIIARSNSTSSSIFNSAIQRGQREGVGATADEEDPNATVPSSPSFFIKHAKIPSLHQLPSLELPAAVSTVPSHLSLPATSSSEQAIPPMQSTSIFSNDFTSSTHPVSPTCPVPNQNVIDWRKLSVSSQGSVDSTSSTNTRAGRHKMFVCSVNSCEKKFYQVAHLRIHERCHTGTRPFVCRFDGCERSFTQLGNLKTHERKHTGERPFKCMYPGCDKTFTQLGNLKTHERIHDQVKRFLCPLADCGKTFNQFGNLKTHTTKMHPDMIISDEELASKVVVGSPRIRSIHAEPALCGSQKKKQAPRHVVTHFNPYQRRPIHPLQSEADFLLREIQAMIRYQEQHGIKPSATTDQESGVMED